jgi:DNA-binding CsgD family transcriptional regulator
MRAVQVALVAAMEAPRRSPEQIGARVRIMAGNQLDPTLAALLAEDPAPFVAGLDAADLSRAVLDAEPGSPVWLSGAGIETALSAIADFGDFKSPHMLGHSRRVASLASAAARAASLPEKDAADIGRAGLIHDIGRVGVQAHLLSKTGQLSLAEHERIRLHSYLTGRVFAGSPELAPLGLLGSSHHERMDGSGYHRGLSAPALSAPARLLAAANAWCALTEPRPHRPQMTANEAAAALSAQARAGLYDRRAVDAVLTAAGQKGARSRRAASSALSEREIEVLRLLSRERTNAAIADQLGLSPKTVERHVTHIYDKLGVATRAGAAVWALENGLL